MLLFRFLQHKTELGLILSSDILRHDFVVSFAFNNRVFLIVPLLLLLLVSFSIQIFDIYSFIVFDRTD